MRLRSASTGAPTRRSWLVWGGTFALDRWSRQQRNQVPKPGVAGSIPAGGAVPPRLGPLGGENGPRLQVTVNVESTTKALIVPRTLTVCGPVVAFVGMVT